MIKQRNTTVLTSGQTLTVSQMGDILSNSASAQTYKMPSASDGLWYRITNINSGLVTITDPSDVTIAVLRQHQSCLLLNNGTKWYTQNLQKSGVDLGVSSDQAITTATSPNVAWTFEIFDNGGFFTSASNTKITIPDEFDGATVLIGAGIRWEPNGTGGRFCAILKNTTPVCAMDTVTAGTVYTRGYSNISKTFFNVSSGDYFQIQVYQNSGGDLDITTNARTFFQLVVL